MRRARTARKRVADARDLGKTFCEQKVIPYDRKSYRRFPKRRKDAAIKETFSKHPFQKTLIASHLRGGISEQFEGEEERI